jgi:hypothetical protein
MRKVMFDLNRATLAVPVLPSSSTVSGFPPKVSTVSVLSSSMVTTLTSPLLSSPSTDQNIPSPPASAKPSEFGYGFTLTLQFPCSEIVMFRFWNSKVAVGGTFAAIGFVLVGVIALIVLTCVRRWKMERRVQKTEEQHTASSFDMDDPEDWRYSSTLDPFAASRNTKPTLLHSSSSCSEKFIFGNTAIV